MQNLISNLCIVMVETSHPGNIGSAARAMKTMGLTDLRLVAPQKPFSQDTWALASGADTIVEQAKIVPDLQSAVADCHIVIGSSARSERTLRWPQMDSHSCGKFVAPQLTQHKVALVFGRESSGLSNEELELCHRLVHIPMGIDSYSLNIAAAVQVLCYECAMAIRAHNEQQEVTQGHDLAEPLANHEALESFYTHLEKSLIEVRYLDPENPRLLMRRMRRLFGRAGVTSSEMSLLRGMLSAFEGRKFRSRNSDG